MSLDRPPVPARAAVDATRFLTTDASTPTSAATCRDVTPPATRRATAIRLTPSATGPRPVTRSPGASPTGPRRQHLTAGIPHPAHRPARPPAMRQAMLHRRAPLTIRVPRITLATPRGNPRTPLLQPLAIPHEQRPPLLGYPSSRITSAALCSYRSYNSTARLRCSLEYLATMTTPPAQGVQHSVTTPHGRRYLGKTRQMKTVKRAKKLLGKRPTINRHSDARDANVSGCGARDGSR